MKEKGDQLTRTARDTIRCFWGECGGAASEAQLLVKYSTPFFFFFSLSPFSF